MLEYLGQKEYVEAGLKGLKPTSANNSLWLLHTFNDAIVHAWV